MVEKIDKKVRTEYERGNIMSNSNQAAGERLNVLAEQLAEQVTDEQYRSQPDLNARFGPSGRMRTKQDSLYHLRFLAQSVSLSSPLLFIQYITWLKELLAQYKITEQDIRTNLQLIREALDRQIESPFKEEILNYLNLGMLRLAEQSETQPFIAEGKPFYREADAYLKLLLAHNRREAAVYATSLLDEGTMSIRELYMYVFQASQYEIGRLWQRGELTVAQEHFCTACTQSIISSLYPRWLGPSGSGKCFVSACVGGELHEIGVRMLTDFFEMDGWDTFFLGANLPAASLLAFLRERQPDVVALSATMTFHVELVRELIGQIRADKELALVKIMVGGMPFNIDRELWWKVGADGYAPDAEQALAVAKELTKAG